MISALLALDGYAFKNSRTVKLLLQYFCPLGLAMFILHVSPRIQFKLMSCQKWELKSEKDHSFLSQLNSNLVHNLVILPFFVQLMLVKIFRPPGDTNLWLLTLQSMPSIIVRTLMQLFLAVALNQLTLNPEALVEAFGQAVDGKRKFEHYFYDVSLKTSLAIGFFTFGLAFCLLVPVTTPLFLALFIMQYYTDKYNLMYYYPPNFESLSCSRKLLIKNSFYGVLLF